MHPSKTGSSEKRQAAAELKRAFMAEQNNALDEAEKIYAGILQKFPEFADAWHYYGLLLHQRGNSDHGLAALHRAHQLNPDNPLFLFNVSQVLMDTGDIEQGLACIRRAHELDPEHAQIFMRYAQWTLEQDHPETVLPEIEHHLKKSPDAWRLWMLAGQWKERAGDFPGALQAFEKAISLAPNNEPGIHVQLGFLHRTHDQPGKAKEAFETAIRRDPNNGRAYSGLALVAAQEGNFEDAKKMGHKALQLNPNAYSSWWLLSNISDKEETHELLAELVEAERAVKQSFRSMPIYFALGKLYESSGEYDKAFANLLTGNALMAQMSPYSKEAENRIDDDICEQINSGFINRTSSVGVTGSGAIFICGMARSGTTLLETIIGSHPDVAMGGEMRFLSDWLTRQKMHLPASERELIGTWASNASNELLGDLARTWHDTMREFAKGHARITDKLPDNFRHIGLITACLPDARIIYVHRDPRDNCVSCFATPFATGHSYSYTLESLGHYYRQHEKLIKHWKKLLPPGKILDVTYEDLIKDPEAQIRRILDYLGLPWDARCLSPEKTERVVATASLHQVRQPIYSSSVGRWQRFEKHLQPLFDSLGMAKPT